MGLPVAGSLGKPVMMGAIRPRKDPQKGAVSDSEDKEEVKEKNRRGALCRGKDHATFYTIYVARSIRSHRSRSRRIEGIVREPSGFW